MTLQRVVTAVVLIPIVVAAVWWGPLWLVAILVGVITILALYEFFSLSQRAGLRAYPRWTMLCALGMIAEQWTAASVETRHLGGGLILERVGQGAGHLSVEPPLLIFVLGVGVLGVMGRRAVGEILSALSASAAGILLVALPLSYLVRLDGIRPRGPLLVLFVLILVWVGDTCAYFVGRSMGRLKMAPVLSPNKTWEGALANLLGSLAVGMGFERWINIPPVFLLLGAAFVNVAGQLGDLLESAYKRSAGVKDSGGLLPGHGGTLDRIDSLILAVPVAWWWFGWILSGGH